ncbi:hypothetical protein D3C76_1131210 [compost metagenome]
MKIFIAGTDEGFAFIRERDAVLRRCRFSGCRPVKQDQPAAAPLPHHHTGASVQHQLLGSLADGIFHNLLIPRAKVLLPLLDADQHREQPVLRSQGNIILAECCIQLSAQESGAPLDHLLPESFHQQGFLALPETVILPVYAAVVLQLTLGTDFVQELQDNLRQPVMVHRLQKIPERPHR